MKNIKHLLIIVLIGFTCGVSAQIEPHFSQYYMHPLWLNPALTGAINGDYRVGLIHRNQWNSITNAFSTIGLSGDVATSKNINFGASLLQQSAGDAGYKYFNGQASVSYSGIRFGKEGLKVISFALQAGVLDRRFDFSKLRGGNQYKDFFGFDPTVPLNESFARQSSTIFDMGTGIAYFDTDPDKKVNIFAGFAASHITQPKDPFYAASSDAILPIRYTAHGGARVVLSEKASIVPNAVFIKQASSTEFMLGGYLQMGVTDNIDIMGGVNYRIKDAFYPYVGLNFNNVIVGLSYDINASQLGKAARGASSYEFSLMFTNRKGTDKGFFKCPRF